MSDDNTPNTPSDPAHVISGDPKIKISSDTRDPTSYTLIKQAGAWVYTSSVQSSQAPYTPGTPLALYVGSGAAPVTVQDDTGLYRGADLYQRQALDAHASARFEVSGAVNDSYDIRLDAGQSVLIKSADTGLYLYPDNGEVGQRANTGGTADPQLRWWMANFGNGVCRFYVHGTNEVIYAPNTNSHTMLRVGDPDAVADSASTCLVWRQSGKYLVAITDADSVWDVPSGSATAHIQLFANHSGTNQRFVIEPVTGE